MLNNPRLYHRILTQIRQWATKERITRQRNMALLIMGLYLSMNIHLSKIVSEWPVPGKIPSLTNRLRRFLNNDWVTAQNWYWPVIVPIIQVLAHHEIRLLVDCTKIGFNHRLMSISIAYRRRAIPLVWSVHRGRKGDVSVEEQITLFKQLRYLIPRSATVWVYGDCGFQYVPLLSWIRRQGWHFVIRQKGNVQVYRAGQGWQKLNAFGLKEGQTQVVGWVRLTRKHQVGWYWLVLHWKKGEDEPWYLVSNRQDNLIKRYKVRMWTEEMYGDMKGHGFDLEATHLDDPDRLARLFLAVAITFVWFISLGSWVVKRGFRHLVDRKDRRDKSYFRLGWDWLKYCQRHNQPLKLIFVPYL